MLKKSVLCFASLVLASLITTTAQADPLIVSSGFFGGTTTGVDRPWSLNLVVSPNLFAGCGGREV